MHIVKNGRRGACRGPLSTEPAAHKGCINMREAIKDDLQGFRESFQEAFLFAGNGEPEGRILWR